MRIVSIFIVLLLFTLGEEAYCQYAPAYSKVSKWFDGSEMNDSKVDGMVYKKEKGVYYRINNIGKVNIRWFGAIGDGIADDTKAIQKAIDLLYYLNQPKNITGGWMHGGGVVFIPSGKYRINKVFLRDNISIVGEDKASTLLISDKPGICLTNIVGRSGVNLIMSRCVKISNLFITGGGLELVGAYDSKIQNTKIFNAPIGISLGLTVNMTIDDVQIYNCKKGIYFNGYIGNGSSTTLKINNVWVAHCTEYGMEIDMAKNKLVTTSIRNSIFEYCSKGVSIKGDTEQLIFDNIHFEGNKIANLMSGEKTSFYARDIWSDSSSINIEGANTQRASIILENVISKVNIASSFLGTIYIRGNTLVPNSKGVVNYKLVK